MHHTTIPHRITTVHTWHCTTSQHHNCTPCRTYSTSHRIPHHGYIGTNKAQHPTSGIANRCTSRGVIWWCEMCGVRCGLMWNSGELRWWDVECITHCHCISHIIPHQTLTVSDSKPHHIPRHTIIPHHITDFITHQHLSQHTGYSTIPYFKAHHWYRPQLCTTPHLALHPISHYVLHNATLHVLHATFQITPYIGQIMHRTTTSRNTPHFTQHSTASCITASFHHIWPWSHPIPHPTTMFHIKFHITHQYTTF